MGPVGARLPAGGPQSSSSPSPPRNWNWMSGGEVVRFLVRYLVGGSLVVGALGGFAAIVWNTVKMHSKTASLQEDISLLRTDMARDMKEVRKIFEILGQKVDLRFEHVASSIQENGSDSDTSEKEKKDISLLRMEMARDMTEVRKNFEILGQKVDLRFEHVESSIQESSIDVDTSEKEKNDISLLRTEMAQNMMEVQKNFEILGQKMDQRFEHVESSIQESGSVSEHVESSIQECGSVTEPVESSIQESGSVTGPVESSIQESGSDSVTSRKDKKDKKDNKDKKKKKVKK